MVEIMLVVTHGRRQPGGSTAVIERWPLPHLLHHDSESSFSSLRPA
jgi:hypothetical protein